MLQRIPTINGIKKCPNTIFIRRVTPLTQQHAFIIVVLQFHTVHCAYVYFMYRVHITEIYLYLRVIICECRFPQLQFLSTHSANYRFLQHVATGRILKRIGRGGGEGRRIQKIPSIIYLKCFFLIFQTICTQIIFKKFKVAKCTQNKLIPKN